MAALANPKAPLEGRPRPSIKPMARMRHQTSTKWEMKIGLIQLVLVLGLMTGSLVAAYIFGYLAGHGTGYDNALSSSISNLARFPVTLDQEDVKLSDEIVTDIYSKLSDKSEFGEEDLPAISAKSPVIRDLRELSASNLVRKESTTTLPSKALKVKEERAEVLLSDLKEGLNLEKSETKPKRPAVVDRMNVEGANGDRKKIAKLTEKPKVEAAKVEAAKVVKTEQAIPESNSRLVSQSKFLKTKISKGWYAQVSAPRQIKDADGLAARLRKGGFPVVIEKANVRGQSYYRVLVGPEGSRTMTERLVSQLRREGVLPSEPFIKQIK